MLAFALKSGIVENVKTIAIYHTISLLSADFNTFTPPVAFSTENSLFAPKLLRFRPGDRVGERNVKSYTLNH